jgi:hypothetical protein
MLKLKVQSVQQLAILMENNLTVVHYFLPTTCFLFVKEAEYSELSERIPNVMMNYNHLLHISVVGSLPYPNRNVQQPEELL